MNELPRPVSSLAQWDSSVGLLKLVRKVQNLEKKKKKKKNFFLKKI